MSFRTNISRGKSLILIPHVNPTSEPNLIQNVKCQATSGDLLEFKQLKDPEFVM